MDLVLHDRILSPRIPDGKAPRFPKKPEIRQEGDKLIMECLLEANPEPEVTWFKGIQVSALYLHPSLQLNLYNTKELYFLH